MPNMEIDNYLTPEDETILLRDGKEKITQQRLFDVVKDCSSFIDETTESEEHTNDKACAYIFVFSRLLRLFYLYVEDNSTSESHHPSKDSLEITEEIKDFLRRGLTAEAIIDLHKITIISPLQPSVSYEINKFNKTVLSVFAEDNSHYFTVFMYFNGCYHILKSIKKGLTELNKTIDWEK